MSKTLKPLESYSYEQDMKEIVDSFVLDIKRDSKQLRILADMGDETGIRKISHDFQGIGGAYNMDFVTEAGRIMSEYAKNKYFEKVKDVAEELLEIFNNINIKYY